MTVATAIRAPMEWSTSHVTKAATVIRPTIVLTSMN